VNLRARIIELLTTHRLPLADEKLLQLEISKVLADDGLLHLRELRLGKGDIVDFLVLDQTELPLSGVAIEIKVKGNRRDIYRQLERYCTYECVREIVLATNVPMGLPVEINGKPASLAALGRGWL